MRFLNPKTDFAFKRIFGSAESKDILLSFINAILGLESSYRIIDLEILDPYNAPKIRGMKDTYLDVRARDGQDKEYIIEMQVLNVMGFEKRVLYNACKAYAGQIGKGKDYHLLTSVIAITITDFMMFPELTEIVTKYKLRAEQGDVYSDDLELVFAELPKFTKEEDGLATTLDRWLFFLKNVGKLSATPEFLKAESAITQALDLANTAWLSEEELDDQFRREMFIQDQRGALEFAWKKGFAQGMDEARKNGATEGLHAVREGEEENADLQAQIVTEAHGIGLSLDAISRITDLDMAQVSAILLDKKAE